MDREAFEDTPLGVRALLAESEDYARSIGDSLKIQVYDALRHLAQGFLDHSRNQLNTEARTLREIYDNSLIVLYRLLFILYGLCECTSWPLSRNNELRSPWHCVRRGIGV